MVTKKLCMGMLVMMLVFGITVIGCDNDPSEEFPAPKGNLTINGLSDFDGKYVYVQGVAGNSVLIGLNDITGYPSDISYKLIKISDGKAVVPLYMANASASSYSNSYIAYNGDDTITLVSIIILSEGTLKTSNASDAIMNNLGIKRLTSGTFSNGNMTVDWEPDGGNWSPEGVSPIQLTEKQWEDIYYYSAEQWYTFTATASTQFVYFVFDTLSNLYVQLYDSNGETIGGHVNLYGSNNFTSWQITSGEKYYINVWPNNNESGSYQITFNSTNTIPFWSPPTNNSIPALTENIWNEEYFYSSDSVRWFKFSATAYTQYIHVYFTSVSLISVHVYDNNGNMIGGTESWSYVSYNTTRSIDRPLVPGNSYYIKIWPRTSLGSASGGYKIAFTSGITPPLN